MPYAAPVTWEDYIRLQRAQGSLLIWPQQLDALERLFFNTKPEAEDLLQIAVDLVAPILEGQELDVVDLKHKASWSILWSIFLDVIQDLPDQNDKLVDVVLALQKLTDADGVSYNLPNLGECLSRWIHNCNSHPVHMSLLHYAS